MSPPSQVTWLQSVNYSRLVRPKFKQLRSYVKQSKAVPPWRSLGGEEYSSYLFPTSALDGMSGLRHAPAAPYPRRKDPRYPLYRRLGGPQSRSGHRG
jgi:hypothetical protein